MGGVARNKAIVWFPFLECYVEIIVCALMMSVKVSIIVPVYNSEPYLDRCLDSILSQSFTDLELLLIDDGSTDGSGAICDAYATKDDRVRVFHKANGGVSSARNLGIDNAQGEWLYFVDSDDELLPDGLQTLVDGISDDVDVVMGGYVDVDEQGVESCQASDFKSYHLSKKQSVTTMYTGYGLCYFYLGYVCLRLLRRSLIERYALRFDTEIFIKEDTLFMMQYVCRSNGITQYNTKPVYRYYQRPDSAMRMMKQVVNSKYVSSFYAFVKMKHEVEALFPSYSEPVFVAKQGIYGRYDSIIGMMDSCHVEDEALRNELYTVMRKEVGSVFLFKVRRKLRKLF